MSNSIESKTEQTPLTLALIADCKATNSSDMAGHKAHRLLASEGYRSADLMSPLTKGSTCSEETWEYFKETFKESLSKYSLHLYANDTKGLTDQQKVERRKIGKRFTHMTGNWRKGLLRIEKAIAEEEGYAVVKASFETKVHEKLSTLLKQLEGKEQFNGNIVELVKNIQTSLTHIKLK